MDVWTSVGLCCLLSVFFVFSLYFVDPGLPRNHPQTVVRRIWAIGVVCFSAPCLLYLFLISHYEPLSPVMFASLLGVRWNGFMSAVCYPTVLTLILYAGPLFQNWIDADVSLCVIDQRKDIVLRNFLIAPLAEELIFRACMLPLLSPALGEWRAILFCPLFFGLAHVHHLIDWYRRDDKTSFNQACFSVFLQFCYTSIFGIYTGFLFVRTRHLICIVLCHSLCNLMGLPPIELVFEHSRKGVIISVYILGAFLFLLLLFPFTNPDFYYN